MTFYKILPRHFLAIPWIAEGIALIGAVWYAAQSFYYAHLIVPTLDESSYLYKGYLFADGIYRPFQDYGPWTNKMPLAFLIPGWAQALLGPGLRSGRYFAIFLGLLMLLGLWLTTRRFSGNWWAAAVVWGLAANSISIRIFAQALSEGLTAFMLAWILFFILGDGQKLWQTTLGAFLTGVMVATRQNMLPLVPFLVAYIFWQHGKRAGWWAALGCALPLLIFHAIYWPDIMRLWLPWLPQGIIPFMDQLRNWNFGDSAWTPQVPFLGKVSAFWTGFRFNFIPIIGTLCASIFWSKKTRWKTPAHFKAFIMLLVLMFILTVFHGWAALGKEYCQYCFSLYIAFYSVAGYLLVAISFSAWEKKPGFFQQFLAVGATLACATGVAYSAARDISPYLMNLPVPRMRGAQILPGSAELWGLLANKFNLSYDSLVEIIPTAVGLLVGLSILLIVLVYFLVQRKRMLSFTPGYLALVIFFTLGVVLTPTLVLGGGEPEPVCGDVIVAYENAGAHLAKIIPPGSRIFWDGGLVTAPLLYVPGIKIYPPQLNDGYSRRIGGDADQLYRHSYWNDELANQWLHEADYILVEGWRYQDEIRPKISLMDYTELAATPPILTCKSKTQIRVFRRVP